MFRYLIAKPRNRTEEKSKKENTHIKLIKNTYRQANGYLIFTNFKYFRFIIISNYLTLFI